jgi:hypothetical protein
VTETAGSNQSVRQKVLDEIRASIIAQRGSLEGLLDKFLAERREEARRDEQDSEPASNQSEALHDE